MKIGFLGLGRMGYNMCLRLIDKKHKLVVFDVDPKPGKRLARKGAQNVESIADLVAGLPRPRIVWLMIPAQYVDMTLRNVVKHLKEGDIVIDGGNSHFRDSQRRYKNLKRKGVKFVDVGTSGGVEGARRGACMMIGGDRSAFKKTEKLYKDMCVKKGYGYMGKSGAGHFVKGVHNAIEYGMLGAIGEALEMIKKFQPKFSLDVKEAVKVYAHGSIIEGRLMSWTEDAMNRKGFSGISCEVPKGETEEEMRDFEKMAHMPVLHAARKSRRDSRKGKFCQRVVAGVRKEFGGHKVKRK